MSNIPGCIKINWAQGRYCLDEDGFKKFSGKAIDERSLQNSIEIVKETELFLKSRYNLEDFGQVDIAGLREVMQYLREKRKNTKDNLRALLRYTQFVDNREIEIALKELLDGSDVLENLSSIVKKALGEKRRRKIFEGISLPPLGTFAIDKPKTTRRLMEKLEAELGEKQCRKMLLKAPHAPPKKVYLPERKAFQKSWNIDNFLLKHHKKYIAELEQHMKQGTLYFTQEINEDALNYVRNTPTCQNGVREGDIIYVTKIPYMAKKYLKEKNLKMKRYYYCHCSWVREAIKADAEISPDFCYCSAGFEKRPWDVIFKRSVKADVLETVLKGDLFCRFAIHIPEEYLKTKPREQLKKQGTNT